MSVSSAKPIKLLRLEQAIIKKGSVKNMHKVYHLMQIMHLCNHGYVHGVVQVIVCMSFSYYYSSTYNCRMEKKVQSLFIPCHHPLLPQ